MIDPDGSAFTFAEGDKELPSKKGVTPAGIEPASSESESEILSIVLRSQIMRAKILERFAWINWSCYKIINRNEVFR